MKLHLHQLETRENPVNIYWDYTFAGDWFTPERRAILEQVAAPFEARITNTLEPVTVEGLFFTEYDTLTQHTTYAPADTLVVYVDSEIGGQASKLAEGGPGGSIGEVRKWGGSIVFNECSNWNIYDFHHVATHELGHVFGFGTSTEYWNNLEQIRTIAPLHHDNAHWAGSETDTSLRYLTTAFRRVEFSEKDFRALAVIGWDVWFPPVPVIPEPVAVEAQIIDLQPAPEVTVTRNEPDYSRIDFAGLFRDKMLADGTYNSHDLLTAV